MREFFRPAVATLSIACLASVLALASADIAFAQAKQQQPAAGQAAPPPAQPPEVKQMALTDKQIEAVLAAKKDFDTITDKLPDNVPADQKGSRSSTPSPGRTASPTTRNTQSSPTISASCSPALTLRPRNMSERKR